MITRPKKRVLIVDKQLSTRDVCHNALADTYEVDHVLDGPAALTALERHDYDAVLLDATLPYKGGPAVLRYISRYGIDAPVIVTTGTIPDIAGYEGLYLPMLGYLVKPFSRTQVRAWVDKVCYGPIASLRRSKVVAALKFTSGDQSMAALRLEIPLELLQRKIQEYHIGPEELTVEEKSPS